MRYWLSVVVCIWAILPLELLAQNLDSVEGDRQALSDLYNATNGGSWSNDSGWMSGNPSNNWHGVEVNENGRVVRLDLSDNNLVGELPESIGNLTKIKYLNFKQNRLTGEIPGSISRWSEIQYLLLSGNEAGDINWDNLNYGYNAGYSNNASNKFNGDFPDVWGNLRKLKAFQLAGSEVTKIYYPSISALENVQWVITSWSTELYQQLPEELFYLPNLAKLIITRSKIYGTLPSEADLPELRSIYFKLNKNLSGALPDISSSKKIRELYMHENDFTGEFPSYLLDGTHTDLFGIYLSWNKLTGTLPDFTPSRANRSLRTLVLDGNEMTGNIPESISLHNELILLALGWNNFSGQIPQNGWENHKRTRYIRLANNNLEGPIPDQLPNSPNLQYLHFENNNLSGNLSLNHAKYKDSQQYPVFNYINISDNKFHNEEYQPLLDELGSGKLRVGTQNPDGDPDDGTSDPTPPAAPSLESPSNNSAGLSVTPAFSWSSVNAESYTLQVFHSDGSLALQYTGSGTSYNTPLSRSLSYETEYTWRVRAGRDGLTGEWSSVWAFTTGSSGDGGGDGEVLPAPEILSPADGATEISLKPTVEWSSVDADYYILHLDDPETGELIVNAEVSGTSYTLSQSLSPETEYKWRVRGVKDEAGGEWSSIAHFTTLTEEEELQSAKVEMKQNYPNPFNPSTSIQFALIESQDVTLKIYDMTGRLVATLFNNQSLSAGQHSATFDAQGLASGVYFYRLTTQAEIITRRMTLMK